MSISELSSKYIKVSEPTTYVALVELSREPSNAFNEELWNDFRHAFEGLSQHTGVRAVVLTSAITGQFSSGLDPAALGILAQFEEEPARKGLQIQHFLSNFQKCFSGPENCPFPVVAALHGAATGLSLDISAACDIRLTAAETTFSHLDVNLAMCADAGVHSRMAKVCGNQSLVNQYALTGLPFTPEVAKEMGFVSTIVPGGRAEVVAAAVEIAKVIASKSPVAVVGTKRTLLHARDNSVQANLDQVSTWNAFALQTMDVPETLKAMGENRAPVYPPVGKPRPVL